MGAVYPLPREIKGMEAVAVSATAADVSIAGRSFFIQNTSASDPIYFKEKNGVAATSSNAWKLAAGEAFPEALTADTLSIVGSASGSAIIMYVE